MREVTLRLPQRKAEYEDDLTRVLDSHRCRDALSEDQAETIRELRDALRAGRASSTHDEVVERCAQAAEAFDDPSRDWLDRSVWDNIKRDTAARIRRLKTGAAA